MVILTHVLEVRADGGRWTERYVAAYSWRTWGKVKRFEYEEWALKANKISFLTLQTSFIVREQTEEGLCEPKKWNEYFLKK